MAAPAQIDIDAAVPTDFSVAEASPHVVVYNLWIQLAGAAPWNLIGTGRTDDKISDHFIVMPPLQAGTQFAYSLAVGGAANTPWRVRLTVNQPQLSTPAISWDETGVTSNDGGGLGHETRFAQLEIV